MMSIIEYLENEFSTFDVKPFGLVDSLVLSQLSYIDFDQIVPSIYENNIGAVKPPDCLRAERFALMFGETRYPPKNKSLLFAAAASPRFRNIKMTGYVSEFDAEKEMQFSALSFILPDNSVYIAYRGTDDTLIGWKEDFNMAFVYPIPSQEKALSYLLEMGRRLPGPLIIGGHSKGGNLAVYAALAAPEHIQARIVSVFDHDGPGFKEGTLDCYGYRNIESRIQKTIPQSSMIGMLLEGHKKYTVVESNRIGVMQHDPFSWKISEDGFITKEEVYEGAKYVNNTIRDWISGLSQEDRERFTDLLFDVLDAGDARTFSEITTEWKKNLSAIFSALRDSDPEMRKFIAELVKDFGSLLLNNLHVGNKLPHFRARHAEENA